MHERTLQKKPAEKDERCLALTTPALMTTQGAGVSISKN